MGLVANAGTIYLVGSGTVNGSALPGGPSGNCLAVTSDTEVYTFTVENIGWLKISDTNASDWATFNKNGFTINGKGDYALSAADLGKTFNLWYSNGSSEGTNNINPPSSGKYIYTLTKAGKGTSNSTLVVTAEGDQKIEYEIYLRGSWDNYGTSANYKFSTTDQDNFSLAGVTLSKGTKFKVADANWGAINFGGAGNVNANTSYTLSYNGSDMTLNQDINNATVKFTLSTNTLYIDDPSAEPDVPVLPDYSGYWLHIGGEFNNNDFYNDGVQPNSDNIASFPNLAIGAGTFKVHVWNGTKDIYYVYDNESNKVPTDTWAQFAEDGYDIYDYVEGGVAGATYNVQYNVATNQIYIESTGDNPPTPPVTDFPETLYLLGNVNGNAWATNAGPAATGNEGIYVWEGVEFDDANNGTSYMNIAEKLGTSANDWDNGPNTGNRYGAPATDTPLVVGTAGTVTLYAVGVNASGCQSWAIPAGTYDVTLNLEEMTILLEETPQTEEPEYGENYTATYVLDNVAEVQKYNSSIPAFDDWIADGTNKYFSVTELTNEGTKITFSGGSQVSNQARLYGTATKYDLRIYNTDIVKVEAAPGYTLSTITFTTVNSTNSAIAKMTMVDGEPGTFTNSSDRNMTWTAPETAAVALNEDGTVTSMSFNAGGTIRLSTITVSSVATDVTTAVEGIEADVDATPVYYNLQGVRVANPERGIFIKVVGNKATKVVR